MKSTAKHSAAIAVITFATVISASTFANTVLTFKSHSLSAGGSESNLEGVACPSGYTLLSGSCHPGYTDQVRIINQYPNKSANTWRCGFHNNSGSARTAWVYTLCDQAGPTGINHQVQVRRYSTASLTNSRADQILTDATTVLQTNDGPGDVACGTLWTRDGNVTAFSNGDGSIDSSAEFNTVIGLTGHIKVVNQINWCGGLIPNVIGCAPVPGSSLVVVRFTNSLEGILWAHEYGHNKGRSHRNDTNVVMHPTIGSTRRRVNQTECNAYLTLPATEPVVDHIVLAQYSGAGPMGSDGQSSTGDDVQEFVHQIYIHGVPYEEASKFDSKSIPALVEMLKDPAKQAYWPNIVVVLGMIGDPKVLDPLVTFIEKPHEGMLKRDHYVAKTSALMSLGYLINKSGDQRALDYLKKRLDPQSWAGGQVGYASFQSSTSERNIDFSKHAILGLALSGRPEAAEVLRTLQEQPSTTGERALRAQMEDLISSALQENKEIAHKGLVDYYRERQQ